jgi:predicted PurR-regulated permease PerM
VGIFSFLAGGVGKSVIDAVKDLADDFITTDEERFEQLLKKEELRLKEEQLNLEREKAHLADTQSARETYAEISTSQAAPFLNKIFPSVLAFTTVVLTFVLFFYFAQGKFTGDQKDIVIYILGVLSTITTQIFAFYFGSSVGSKEKTELIKKLGGNK